MNNKLTLVFKEIEKNFKDEYDSAVTALKNNYKHNFAEFANETTYLTFWQNAIKKFDSDANCFVEIGIYQDENSNKNILQKRHIGRCDLLVVFSEDKGLPPLLFESKICELSPRRNLSKHCVAHFDSIDKQISKYVNVIKIENLVKIGLVFEFIRSTKILAAGNSQLMELQNNYSDVQIKFMCNYRLQSNIDQGLLVYGKIL